MGERKHKKRKFRHTTQLEREQLTSLFEELLTGIQEGALVLDDGEQTLTLRPEGPIVVEIDARQKPGRASMTLTLAWRPAPVEYGLRVGHAAPLEAGPTAPDEPPEPPEPKPEPDEADEPDELESEAPTWSAEALARLPKARLYALARAVELEGRSQLHKRALARALSELELGPHLDADELESLAELPPTADSASDLA